MFLMNALATVGSIVKKEMLFVLISAAVLAYIATVNETFFVGATGILLAVKVYLDMSTAIMSEARCRN